MTEQERIDDFIAWAESTGVTFKSADGPLTSKTGGDLTIIGVDYGAKSSVAVVMQRHADGSFTVVEQIEGKGLDDLNIGTSAAQKSDGRSDGESDGF